MSDAARLSDPSTSHEAAAKATKMLSAKQALVEKELVRAGANGLTDHELIKLFRQWPESTSRKRRCELVALGKVVANGEKRMLPTGSNAKVWMHASFVVAK